MTQLRWIGFFRDLPHGDPQAPLLSESIRTEAQAEEEKVVSYLQRGVVLAGSPMVLYDIFDSEVTVGTAYLLTDGVWAWPSDLPYYVSKYHCVLPLEFVQHMKSRDWTPPSQKDINLDELVEDQGSSNVEDVIKWENKENE